MKKTAVDEVWDKLNKVVSSLDEVSRKLLLKVETQNEEKFNEDNEAYEIFRSVLQNVDMQIDHLTDLWFQATCYVPKEE